MISMISHGALPIGTFQRSPHHRRKVGKHNTTHCLLWLKGVLALQLSFVGSILLAILSTHTQLPTQFRDLGFSICNGQPCYKNLVPGQTLWESGKEILRRDTSSQSGAERIIVHPSNDIKITVLISCDPRYVGEIYVTFPRNVITLGEIISVYGIPTRTFLYVTDSGYSPTYIPHGSLWVLYYPTHYVNIRHTAGHLDWSASVSEVGFFDPIYCKLVPCVPMLDNSSYVISGVSKVWDHAGFLHSDLLRSE